MDTDTDLHHDTTQEVSVTPPSNRWNLIDSRRQCWVHFATCEWLSAFGSVFQNEAALMTLSGQFAPQCVLMNT